MSRRTYTVIDDSVRGLVIVAFGDDQANLISVPDGDPGVGWFRTAMRQIVERAAERQRTLKSIEVKPDA